MNSRIGGSTFLSRLFLGRRTGPAGRVHRGVAPQGQEEAAGQPEQRMPEGIQKQHLDHFHGGGPGVEDQGVFPGNQDQEGENDEPQQAIGRQIRMIPLRRS